MARTGTGPEYNKTPICVRCYIAEWRINNIELAYLAHLLHMVHLASGCSFKRWFVSFREKYFAHAPPPLHSGYQKRAFWYLKEHFFWSLHDQLASEDIWVGREWEESGEWKGRCWTFTQQAHMWSKCHPREYDGSFFLFQFLFLPPSHSAALLSPWFTVWPCVCSRHQNKSHRCSWGFLDFI